MFFGYPISSTHDNWLHDSLKHIIEKIHTVLDNEQPIPAWKDIIPTAKYEQLVRRDGLESRVLAYAKACKDLLPEKRQQVLSCFIQQNMIVDLVSCTANCEKLTDLPASIQAEIKDLFEFSFKLLTSLKIRDKHYYIIYKSEKKHICPFCGIEYFDAPGAPREDLDHYLLESVYPFAATNLLNLVPTCGKCNKRYKLTTDILYDDSGNRRKSFFPYDRHSHSITLNGSQPSEATDGLPNWCVEFIPNTPECITWDDVFSLKLRYKRDVLNEYYKGWLEEFSNWFRDFYLKSNTLQTPVTDSDINHVLAEYLVRLNSTGFIGREALRIPVFQMIEYHCTQNNRRLLDSLIYQLEDIISITNAPKYVYYNGPE
jgi:hypothetical protein